MLCCVLAVVLALLVTAAIVSDDVLSQIQRPSDNPTLSSSEIEDILNGDDSATVTGPTIQEGDIDFGGEVTEVIGSGELINILLIGQDARAEGTQRNSDAMILCTINTATKTLTMTSFLRDMYVQIPGYGGNKINACYPLGGMSLLDKCLEQNFGVKVDANVAVDFSGFMKLIDMVGGVKINLTADEANYLNYRGNWDVTGNDGWQLKAGENVLTGSQALAYSRIRALGLDFERTERQPVQGEDYADQTGHQKTPFDIGTGKVTDDIVGGSHVLGFAALYHTFSSSFFLSLRKNRVMNAMVRTKTMASAAA